MGAVVKLLALLCLTASLPALDWSAYDKMLHATAGGLIGYAGSDILERTTKLPRWGRWLVATAGTSAIGWGFEFLASEYYDASDAHAAQVGGAIGAGAQVGVSFILTRDAVGVGYSVRF